jgi:hypothetical protein
MDTPTEQQAGQVRHDSRDDPLDRESAAMTGTRTRRFPAAIGSLELELEPDALSVGVEVGDDEPGLLGPLAGQDMPPVNPGGASATGPLVASLL